MVRKGKGQKGRIIFIGARTRKQIMRYFIKERGNQQSEQEPLFTRQDNDLRIEYDGLKQLVRRVKDASGVSFSCHALRRTFALSCLRDGMNVYLLARLMGHADIAMLRPYLAMVDNDLKDAHQKYGPADNWGL